MAGFSFKGSRSELESDRIDIGVGLLANYRRANVSSMARFGEITNIFTKIINKRGTLSIAY